MPNTKSTFSFHLFHNRVCYKSRQNGRWKTRRHRFFAAAAAAAAAVVVAVVNVVAVEARKGVQHDVG